MNLYFNEHIKLVLFNNFLSLSYSFHLKVFYFVSYSKIKFVAKSPQVRGAVIFWFKFYKKKFIKFFQVFFFIRSNIIVYFITLEMFSYLKSNIESYDIYMLY